LHAPEGAQVVTPERPRVDAALDPPGSPLDDGESWDSVTASRADVVIDGAGDIEIVGSRLSGMSFTGAEHHRVRLLDVVLEDCELSGATLSQASFTRVEFVNCRMSGFVASDLNARDVRWSGCKLDGSNFRNATLDRCAWEDCIMQDADFYGATLEKSGLHRCDLARAEFSKAKCSDVSLHRSTLQDLRGALALRGCTIGSDQVWDVSMSLLAAVGITVNDDDND
jgi:uncharacterized protein YjbI with pentapeptide repeats